MASVAIITGGTSGIGLALGKALAKRPDWKVYLLGTNEQRGYQAVRETPRATFCKADVSNYNDLASTFHEVFRENGRLDFVFANAGVTDSYDIYARQPEGEIPPEPNLKTVDINFNGVLWTSYLALHYFRQSPNEGKGASLVLTGSCTSFYPSGPSPIYTGTKHALVGFMRSIAGRFMQEGIRVNVICPGIVRTNMGSDEVWALTPSDVIIPMDHVVNITLNLLDAEEMVDSRGARVPASQVFGRAVEISGTNYYFQERQGWPDEDMKKTMTETLLAG